MSPKKAIFVVLVLVILASLIIIIALFGEQFNKKQETPATNAPSVNDNAENNGFCVQLEPDRKEFPDDEVAEKIVEGMEIREVYSIMGNPQRDVGSGAVILEWDLVSGEILRVTFMKDVPSHGAYYVEFCSIVEGSST